MQGLEGIIVRRKDRCRVVFSLDLIMRLWPWKWTKATWSRWRKRNCVPARPADETEKFGNVIDVTS